MGPGESFMSYVQLHERAWGMDSYPNRPKLEDILQAKYVAFWASTTRNDPGYRITLHEDGAEINRYLTELVLHSKTRIPDRRLARLFIEKKQYRIKGVKVMVEPIEKP